MSSYDPYTGRTSPKPAFGRRKSDRRSGEERRDLASRAGGAFAWLNTGFLAQVLGQKTKSDAASAKDVKSAYGSKENVRPVSIRLDRRL